MLVGLVAGCASSAAPRVEPLPSTLRPAGDLLAACTLEPHGDTLRATSPDGLTLDVTARPADEDGRWRASAHELALRTGGRLVWDTRSVHDEGGTFSASRERMLRLQADEPIALVLAVLRPTDDGRVDEPVCVTPSAQEARCATRLIALLVARRPDPPEPFAPASPSAGHAPPRAGRHVSLPTACVSSKTHRGPAASRARAARCWSGPRRRRSGRPWRRRRPSSSRARSTSVARSRARWRVRRGAAMRPRRSWPAWPSSTAQR